MVKPLGAAAARVERPTTIVRILEYMIMVMIDGRSEFVYSMVEELGYLCTDVGGNEAARLFLAFL